MEHSVIRDIELDADAEELWRAITDSEELSGWLADEAALDPRVGGIGRFVEDGEVRRAVVEEVVPGERITWRWWREGGDDASGSRVTLTVVPSAGGTRLVVHEHSLVARASVPSLRWEVRLACLAFGLALLRV